MIATQRISRDQFVEVDGAVLQMRRRVTRAADGVPAWQMENPDTGEIVTVSVPEFEIGFLEGRIRRAEDPQRAFDAATRALLRADFGAAPETMRRAAEVRHAYVRAYYDGGMPPRTRAGLEPLIGRVADEIGDARPPAWNTLSRWLAAWERAGTEDVRILLPKFHRRGPEGSTLPPFLRDTLARLIDEVYLTRAQNKAKHVHAALHRAVLAWNGRHGPDEQVACPSLRTVQRHIEAVDLRTRLEKRRGRRAADAVLRPVMKGPEPGHVMEVVEIDHTQLDLVVLDDETGVELGRPWITAAIDRYSRCIVGFHIGFENPSVVSLMLCLRHMMTPKADVRRRHPEVRTEYPCWGVPEMVVNDNGAEFLGESLKEAALQLGFRVEWAPVDCPEFKGRIERFFRTANEEVGHRVSGTVSPAVRQPKAADPGPACMPFGALVARFHRWLLDVYHNEVHEGIGDVPLRRWREGEARREPRRPPSMEALDVLRIVQTAAPKRTGIRWRNLRWNGRVLADIRALPGFAPGDKVRFRIDPLDVHTVQVIHPVTGEALPVGPADPQFPRGVTLFQWQRADALRRARAADARDTAAIMAALDDLRIQAEQLRTGRARIRLNRVARFLDVRMGRDEEAPAAPPATAPAADADAWGTPSGASRAAVDPAPDAPPAARAWRKTTIRKSDLSGKGRTER